MTTHKKGIHAQLNDGTRLWLQALRLVVQSLRTPKSARFGREIARVRTSASFVKVTRTDVWK